MMACVLCPCHGGGRGAAGRVALQFRYGGGHILMGWGPVMGGMGCSLGKYRASTSPPTLRASSLGWGVVYSFSCPTFFSLPSVLSVGLLRPRLGESPNSPKKGELASGCETVWMRVRSSGSAALNVSVMMRSPGNQNRWDICGRVEWEK
ncbi:unnamed protein product [Prunus armeniaca]